MDPVDCQYPFQEYLQCVQMRQGLDACAPFNVDCELTDRRGSKTLGRQQTSRVALVALRVAAGALSSQRHCKVEGATGLSSQPGRYPRSNDRACALSLSARACCSISLGPNLSDAPMTDRLATTSPLKSLTGAPIPQMPMARSSKS